MTSTSFVVKKDMSELIATTPHPSDATPSKDLTSFYILFGVIILPGIITNSMALVIIIRDIRKALFPAIVLLFSLCCADLGAVVFSFIQHSLKKFLNVNSFALCAVLAALHAFFGIYSGVLNGMMAVDRYLAICKPFFYSRKISVSTWKVGCIIAAFATAFFSCFPIFGLGNVTGLRITNGTEELYCDTFSYRADPIEKIFGMTFSALGYLITSIIVTLNSIVIVTAIKLSNRIVRCSFETSTSSGSTSQSDAKQTSIEIAFARQMGGFAAVYLICGLPYNTLFMMRQFNIEPNSSVTGIVHTMVGLSYSMDPIVYIIIKKIRRWRCVCRCHKTKPIVIGIEKQSQK